MTQMIAKLLETDWEETLKSPGKSAKKNWEASGMQSGSSSMFYMGDDGLATFER